MDSFQAKLTVKRIKDDLHSLPRGLDAYDAAYQGAMTRILGQEEEHRDLASRILSLILCAKRPLSTLQVRHALMIQIGDIELDHDSILEVEDILSVCAGLLAVDEKSESIRFVHYTAQEYLQRTREQWLPGAESQIARMCLATLLLEEHAVHKPTLNRSALNLLISSASKFTEYAAMCTLVHLDSIWHDEPSLHACFLTLLKGSRVLSAVEQLDFGYKAHHSHSPTALHLVAYLGLANLTAFCIANGYTVNSKDRQGRTPISYAAEEGHATVAFVLLENQATVDAPDKGSRTPLWYAARKGHKSVVFLLLEKQAAVNPTDQFSRTPLWYAAKAGHESIVRLLLEKQATANFFDTELTTPLSLAARGGHTPVVLLLLEQRAAVNSRDRYSRTPLWHAARAGQESIVLSLLEKRATVDSADQDSVTPLSCAARGGYKSVVSILLDKGASVDSKCRTGRTPLSYAAEWGRVEVVELLLSKGADPLLKSVFGGEPLWYAVHSASSQNYEVVDLMCRAIELRQSLNIKDTDIIASKHAKPPPDTRPTPLPTQDQSLPSPSVSNPSDQVPVDPTTTNHCSSPTTFPQ
jgi:ankyrin repeat protein